MNIQKSYQSTPKKCSKSKKWSLASLFKKRRKSKSSDTDCSSSDESDGCGSNGGKKKGGGFLARKRSVRGREGGSHRVVGKFESIIIPRITTTTALTDEKINVSDSVLDALEHYDASPNTAIRRLRPFNRAIADVPKSVSNQEISACKQSPSDDHPEFTAIALRTIASAFTSTATNITTTGESQCSLDAATTNTSNTGTASSTSGGKRLSERQKAKARAETLRQHRLGRANSSSEDEYGSRTASSASSSLQRTWAKSADSTSFLQRTCARSSDSSRSKKSKSAGRTAAADNNNNINNNNNNNYKQGNAVGQRQRNHRRNANDVSYALTTPTTIATVSSSQNCWDSNRPSSSAAVNKLRQQFDETVSLPSKPTSSCNLYTCDYNTAVTGSTIVALTTAAEINGLLEKRSVSWPGNARHSVASPVASSTGNSEYGREEQTSSPSYYFVYPPLRLSNRHHRQHCDRKTVCRVTMDNKPVKSDPNLLSKSRSIDSYRLPDIRSLSSAVSSDINQPVRSFYTHATSSGCSPIQPATPSKYSADKKPRSRNPIQMSSTSAVRCESTANRRHPDALDGNIDDNFDSSYFNRNHEEHDVIRDDGYCLPAVPSLSTANELGIPDVGKVPFGRPLSTVMEKSEYRRCGEQPTKPTEENVLFDKREKPAAAKSSNLEEALKELEEIYRSLRLSDEELLDGADRRDLSEALKRNLNRYSWSDDSNNENELHFRSTSDWTTSAYYRGSLDCLHPASDDYHRLVPLRLLTTNRRSVIPDKVEDDMAYRKLNKKPSSDPKTTCNVVSQSGSFLLVSPTLSPPPLPASSLYANGVVSPTITTTTTSNEPDITLDDVVYRNIVRTNNTLKVADPQPPFGIPLGPVVSSSTERDYLHVIPKDRYRSSFNPRRTPDVVEDDLAFRTLRKDVHNNNNNNNNNNIGQSSSCRRQNRALRSLSVGMSSSSSLSSEGNGCSSNGHNSNNRKILLGNGNCCVTNDTNNEEKMFSLLADEAKHVSKELNEELRRLNTKMIIDGGMLAKRTLKKTSREFEAISSRNHDDDDDEPDDKTEHREPERKRSVSTALREKEVFVGKVVHHKPITLNRFDFQCNGDDQSSTDSRHRTTIKPVSGDGGTNADSSMLQQTVPTAADCTDEEWNRTRDTNDDESFSLKSICESFDWDNLKTVCSQMEQPKTEQSDRVVNFSDGLYEKRVNLNGKDQSSVRKDKQTRTIDGSENSNSNPLRCSKLKTFIYEDNHLRDSNTRAVEQTSNDLIQSVDNLFRTFIPNHHHHRHQKNGTCRTTGNSKGAKNAINGLLTATYDAGHNHPSLVVDNSSSLLASSSGM